MQFSTNATSLKNIQALEARLTPFLQRKLTRFHSPATAQNQLNESDLFALAKAWNSLSPEFMKLYKEATQIPDGYTYYVSPSGNFEVYYTTTLDGSVDPADNYGFGVPNNWRPKNNQPNGVPDYVDEVAWALDSAWSMEINRFQYIQPLPYTDATHGSNRFKVVITTMDPGWYGETFPDDPVASQGFSSHIEIRNEWSDPDWAGTGYDTVPYSGARVTCAHEFFHTIQFAMAWNLNIDGIPDSFPLSWIEGTAVMMEGLAFEYVHDYIQYTWAYFDNPTITMLDPSDMSTTVYTNSLVTKFLHERYSPDPDNDFIRYIFFNDYNAPVNFYEDLRSVSSSLGKNWVDILNGFHTQSFFTGARAVTGIFIQDAPLLPEWSYSYDTIATTGKLTKQVNPYGMQVFALQPMQVQQVKGDTLGLVFQGDQPTGASAYPTWSASCIFERLNGTDSTVRFTFANNTLAAMEIPSWHSLHDALVIVTNGDLAATSHNASISIQTCPVTYHRGDLQKIHLVSPDSQSAITVDLTPKNDLACSLSIEMVSPTLYKIPDSKLLFSSLYRINYPLFWGSDAAISCTFSVLLQHIATLNTQNGITSDSIQVLRWDSLSSSWGIVTAIPADSMLWRSWKTTITQPGTYGVFGSEYTSLVIFPNPGHIRSKKFIHFEGNGVREVRIYSVMGDLVASSMDKSFQQYGNGFIWQLANGYGKTVVPGYYTAFVTQAPSPGNGKKISLHKVLVFP